MSSLTGLASSSITSMIQGLCTAGQMKLVGATTSSTSSQGNQNGGIVNVTAPSNISIPALTGSQIAIVYIQVTVGLVQAPPSTTTYPAGAMASLTASGTGVNVSVIASTMTGGGGPNYASVPAPATPTTTQTGFCTTSSGSQTISFSSYFNNGLNANPAVSYSAQACVFIYTPPF